VSRAQVDVLMCCTVSLKKWPLMSSKSDIVTFCGCGLICLTSMPHADMLIAAFWYWFSHRRKQTSAVHLLSESISLGIWLGGLLDSTVAKRVCVLFMFLFIIFEKKVYLCLVPHWKHGGCLYRCYNGLQVFSSKHMLSGFLDCLFIFCTAFEFLQGAFSSSWLSQEQYHLLHSGLVS